MSEKLLGAAADVLRSFGSTFGGRHLAIVGGAVPSLLVDQVPAGIERHVGKVHTVRDEPHRAILEVAEHVKADLIVIGNRGLVRNGRFTRETPAKVLRGATCSVLVVDTSNAH